MLGMLGEVTSGIFVTPFTHPSGHPYVEMLETIQWGSFFSKTSSK